MHRFTRLRAVVPLAALVFMLASAFGTASAAAQNNFTCRASLVRTEGFPLPPLNQEPVVANRAAQCEDDSETLLGLPTNPVTAGPVTARALFAETDNGDAGARSEAGVADVTITQAGLPRSGCRC